MCTYFKVVRGRSVSVKPCTNFEAVEMYRDESFCTRFCLFYGFN